MIKYNKFSVCGQLFRILTLPFYIIYIHVPKRIQNFPINLNGALVPFFEKMYNDTKRGCFSREDV